ncbi:HEAT repeat domain-containing protein [Mucisphaera calidilacus]|nr:HEAT repeat domain-containing protein [Mucisphaera calidilacus]
MRTTSVTRRVVILSLIGLMALPGVVMGQRGMAAEELVALREKSIGIVRAAAASGDATLRMNAIEASQPVPGLASELVGPLMLDEVAPVRFAALMTVGELRLEQHAQAAVDMGVDTDHSVRAAAIYAATQNGLKIDVSPLARYVLSTDPSVRGNAAMILGEMGDPSAIALLQEAARQPFGRHVTAIRREIVRVQLAEAEVKLTDRDRVVSSAKDNEIMSPIRAAVYSQSDEIRVLAVSMLGPLDDRRMIPMLASLLENPPAELQLAAARSLILMGIEDGLPIVIRALGSAYTGVRAQAAYTLGDSNDPTTLVLLSDTLLDEDPLVRLSAAAGVLRRLPTEADAQRLARQ